MTCSHYTGPTRCQETAVFWLFAPDDKRVPGCWLCARHGYIIQDEYNDKLKEYWHLQGIDANGDPLIPAIAGER